MTDPLDRAAERLRRAAASGVPCPPVRDLVPVADVASAYAVQQRVTKAAIAAGRRIVGRKIGLTNAVVQAQFGIAEPDFGVLLADMAVSDGAEIPHARLIQPKIEGEIAFVLDRDLDEPGLPLDRIARAIAYALPAIEVVDSRIADWNITIFDTIADNASAGMFVLGAAPTPLDRVDLRGCEMRIDHRGETVATGCGAACLGNPLNAVSWLAERLIAEGEALRAGDVVLSGSLGPIVTVAPGASYACTISGLGTVGVAFGAAGDE